MKNRLLFLTFWLLFAETGYSQLEFQKIYGGSGENQGYCIRQTSDGGYIITGRSNSLGLGWADILIIRTDGSGDTLWTKAIGGTGYEEINSVQETTDGGFILAGTYLPPPSISYALLIKMDSVGNVIWTRAYGNSFTQDAKCVQQTSDGGYILCGNAVVFGNTTNDLLLMKTDSAGSVIWSKYFGTTSSDFAYHVEQTFDGGYVFTGLNGFSTSIIKVDDNGDLQWSKAYSGASGYALHQTNDGGYAIVGERGGSGTGGADIFFSKTDSAGNDLWSYQYGGNKIDRGYSFSETADDNFILSGIVCDSIECKSLLMKIDQSGIIIWSKVYGFSGFSYRGSVIQTSDGGYASISKYDSTDNYIYFVKTDSMGFSGCNQSDTIIPVSAGVAAVNINLAWGAFSIGNVTPVMSIAQTPPSFSVNTLCISNSFSEIATIDEKVLIRPNPTNGSFELSAGNDGIKKIVEIYNLYGEKVIEAIEFTGTSTAIHLNRNAPGIYFVKVSGDLFSSCEKVIVTD